jgi:hypothetical protein
MRFKTMGPNNPEAVFDTEDGQVYHMDSGCAAEEIVATLNSLHKRAIDAESVIDGVKEWVARAAS